MTPPSSPVPLHEARGLAMEIPMRDEEMMVMQFAAESLRKQLRREWRRWARSLRPLREWLARIAADIKRANRWLDPAWKPQPSWQPAITWCDIPANTMTAAATYIWTADGWKAWGSSR